MFDQLRVVSNQEQKERRKYPRFPFIEDILIDGVRMSTSMDISEGGLYISAIQCYEKNSVITVTIPFRGEKLTLKAQVLYCHPGIGIGVMFIDLNAEQSAKLKELIESISRKSVPFERAGKSILLVEDNSLTRQAIKDALSKEGFFVTEAIDGIDAMKSIAEQKLDLIILDLYMKGMDDGFKVLSLLKTNTKWKELPVIICSGHDAQEIKEKAMNAGADQFLSKKGTSPSRLVQCAKELVQGRSQSWPGKSGQ